ncbi:MAG: PDZ domain-containing protein [Planctomycetota bacterium]|nr:PDZ domain-containing protein [Planctomycetota bacterium]
MQPQRSIFVRLVLAAMLALAAPHAARALAQPEARDPDRQALANDYFRRALEAFNRADYAAAEGFLRRQLAIQPRNFVIHYNLACCRSLQGDAPGGLEFLERAIELGFSDIAHLRRDTHLARVRELPGFTRIVDNWPAIQAAALEANLAHQKSLLTGTYREWRDDRLRLVYLSAYNGESDAKVSDELARLADWCETTAMPGVLSDPDAANDAWVIVVLPTQKDFDAWTTSVYGRTAVRGTSMIAGSYEHDSKRLVAMDLGATLRHEFLHVLHWRAMTRRGQAHPIWIMEGLCSLAEDYDLAPDGSVRPVPSWRTNTLRRIERIGTLMPIEDLARLSQLKFTSSRPLAHYAIARGVFLYLAQRERLGAWYTHYTTNYRDDPSGVKSLEVALDMPIEQINADFRAWVRALPEVAEEIAPGKASLGVEVENGSGDGPVVRSVRRRKADPKVDLRPGDVITAVGGRPTRDLAELVRVLSSFEPGEAVEVSYRRVRLVGTTTVTLVAK